MRDALQTPLAFDVLRAAVTRFNADRSRPFWQLAVDTKRTLPINGVSDAFVEKTTLLNRDDELLDNEVSAALEVGYLLRLASPVMRSEERWSMSPAPGFTSPRRQRHRLPILSLAITTVTQPGLRSKRNVTTVRARCCGLSPRRQLDGQRAHDYRKRTHLF